MPRSFPLRILLSLLILAGMIGYAFGPCLSNDFVNWDDQTEIIQNPDFNPVTWTGLAWNWSHTRLSLYMPVTYMVWGAVAAISPRDGRGTLTAFAFHALSLSLHLICSGLVLGLILQLWGRLFPALIGALVFAVHPLQAEPVAWASGMYTVLSTALSVGALMAYVAFARSNPMQTSDVQRPTSKIEAGWQAFSSVRRSTLDAERWTFALPYFTATCLYLLALLTKAASVSLPLAAAVIDLFILGRPIKRVILSVSPWIVLGIPFILLAKHFQDVSQIAAPPLWGRPVVALDAIGFYLGKIVLPIHLIPDYGRNPAWVMQHPAPVAVSAATAVVALVLACLVRRKAPWITAGIGLIVVGTAPYLGLTSFDFQYVSTVADRYAYFAMTGIAVLAAGAAIRSRVVVVALVLTITIWTVLNHQQVRRWRDTDTLFSYTLSENPRSLVSHNVFGFIAAGQGRYADAEAHYLAALRIWPEDATIRFNLGNLYRRTHPDLALEQYSLAVSCQPHFAPYRNNYASLLATTGHVQEAYNQWEHAIADDPHYAEARNNFGDLLENLGRVEEALKQYEAVLRIDPDNVHAATRLASLTQAMKLREHP